MSKKPPHAIVSFSVITLAIGITSTTDILQLNQATAAPPYKQIHCTQTIDMLTAGSTSMSGRRTRRLLKIQIAVDVSADGRLQGKGKYDYAEQALNASGKPDQFTKGKADFAVSGSVVGNKVKLTWPTQPLMTQCYIAGDKRSFQNETISWNMFDTKQKAPEISCELVDGRHAPPPTDDKGNWARGYLAHRIVITRVEADTARSQTLDENLKSLVRTESELANMQLEFFDAVEDCDTPLTKAEREEHEELKVAAAALAKKLVPGSDAVTDDSMPHDDSNAADDDGSSKEEMLARIEEIKQEIANLKAFVDAGFAGDDDRKELAKLEAELARLLAQMDDGPTPASDDDSDGSLPPVLDDDLVVMPSDANVKVTGYVVFKDETSSTGYRPVKRVSLAFKRLGDPEAKIHATQSDDAGRYTVALPRGEYLVDVELSDEWAPLKDQPVTVKPDMDGKYFVAEKATLKRVEVTGIVVARSIVDPNKFTGVRNAEVVFQQRTDRGSYKTLPGLMADGGGRFSDELEPGRYFVQAGASGFFNSRQQAVRIEQGMDPIEIELTRKPDDTPTPQPEPDPMPQPQPDVTPMPEDDKIPPCLLVVWVRDQQGQALSAVNLSIKHSVLGSIQGQTPTWAGSYSKNLVRGTAIVTASKPGYSTAKATAVMDSFSETVNITLRKGGPGPKPGPNLKQNVTFIVRHGGRPVDGASVTVQRGMQSVGMALGKGNGQYQRDLPHGDDYEVTVRWQRLGAKKKFSVPIRGPLLIDLR